MAALLFWAREPRSGGTPAGTQIALICSASGFPNGPPTGSAMLYLKYAGAAVASVLWSVGLLDQLPDLLQTGKYLGISALIVVLAFL
jgi:hypothetical protein